jgi:hypothetical protein
MKSLSCVVAAAGCFLFASHASAEVKLGEVGGWEVFTTGRVNAFLVYIAGDANPVAPVDNPMVSYIAGGGLQAGTDLIPELDANEMPIPGEAGKIGKWRALSGFIPNILSIGARSKVTDDLNIKGVTSIWAPIETFGQRKTYTAFANFNEAYLMLDGSWGSVTGGRTLSLFSRGSYELNYLYGYRYGVGAQLDLVEPGSSAGLIGFGIPAASYNAGIYYTTPSLGGLALALGLFDPARFQQTWDRSETPRAEFELTYDLNNPGFATHVFVNGAYQKIYKANNAKDSDTLSGIAGGLRLEFGSVHLGASVHTGKGVGLGYVFAFDQGLGNVATAAGPADLMLPDGSPSPNKPNELRTFDGFAVMAQYAAGTFDINLAFGQSRAHQLDIDKTKPLSALIKSQTGVGAGFVYHATENLHVSIDYLRAMYRWYAVGEQDVNFINAGATIDW